MNVFLRNVTGAGQHYTGTFALPPYHRRQLYELTQHNQEYVLTPAASPATVVGVFSRLSDGSMRGSVLGLTAAIFVRPFQANIVVDAMPDHSAEAA